MTVTYVRIPSRNIYCLFAIQWFIAGAFGVASACSRTTCTVSSAFFAWISITTLCCCKSDQRILGLGMQSRSRWYRLSTRSYHSEKFKTYGSMFRNCTVAFCLCVLPDYHDSSDVNHISSDHSLLHRVVRNCSRYRRKRLWLDVRVCTIAWR